MKATTTLTAWCICVAGTLVLPSASRGAEPNWPTRSDETVVRGQSPGTVEEPDARELLQHARDAMKKQEWVEADVYLRQAEQRWGLIHNPFGDSPKVARRDLERLRAGAPQKPSEKARPSLLSPLGGGSSARGEARDPFAGGSNSVEAVLDNKKPQAVDYLKKGRDALQQRNVAGAQYFASLAEQQGAAFGPDEDSPAKLYEAIRAQGGRPPESGALAAAGQRMPEIPSAGTENDAIAPLAVRSSDTGRQRVDLDAPLRGGDDANGIASLRGTSEMVKDPQRGNRLLVNARRALVKGDTRSAMQLAAEARGLGAGGGPLDDSPAKIEALVRRHNEVTQRRAARQDSETANKMYAQLLLEEAEALMICKDFEMAEQAAADAARLGARFDAFENNPGAVLKRVAAARAAGVAAGAAAGAADQVDRYAAKATGEIDRYADAATGQIDRLASRASGQLDRFAAQAGYEPQSNPRGHGVSSALYDAHRDRTHNAAAANDEPELAPPPPSGPVAREADSVKLLPMVSDAAVPADNAAPPAANGDGVPAASPQATQAAEWMRQGDAALSRQDRKTARELYGRAFAMADQLDPAVVQQLRQRMQLMEAVAPQAGPAGEGNRLLDETSTAQQRLRLQVGNELNREIRKASEMREKDPRGALGKLKAAKAHVEQSALSPTEKKSLLARADKAVVENEKYIEQHRSEIELNERNETVQGEVDGRRMKKVQVQEKLAHIVDEFNKLRDERRFPEAEAKAKQAMEIAPDEMVSMMMWREVRFWRNVNNNRDISDRQDDGNIFAWTKVEEAGIPMDETRPLQFGDARDWGALSDRRRRFGRDRDRKRNPKEIEIEQKLRSPVAVKFRETPLSEVIDRLKEVAGINIYLDPQGLAQEGVHPSTPVTIDLTQDISLKSALNLILQPLHLGYLVRDEVLKITSEQHKNGNVYTKVYNVGDLVIPIPDFVPHNRVGLPQMIDDAYNRTMANLYGASGFQAPVAQLASHAVNPNGVAAPQGILGQQSGGGITTGGNRGGTSSADFDPLIDMISKTIDPESWDAVGGPGSIKESASNLSLVITQTQEVHERIADLLDQLRRLQDLQVTIEVRFITLSDNFFERIGVDFDFNIRDNATAADVARANSGIKMRPSATLGLQPPTDTNPFPNFTPNGAIPFSQNSFDSAIPPFGGFNPASAATFGIAILSDLEAFFLVQAAQGDARTNIMQAPKVTLFNGQAASISDQSQTPFVTSVTPIVGDFAAAQAPVIVVLNEGTTLSVQAVVSQDRRFVRLTLIPFFSQIGDVTEFQFTGSTTTKSSSANSSQDMGDNTSDSDTTETTKDGTTVQLPTFIFTTVTTTVSVPDGGTVLLGGVKRLKEGRNEFGVPIMSKIPYINRLFKNVGIGREAQSLMLMVTPRIIIQEEEEEKLGLAIPEE